MLDVRLATYINAIEAGDMDSSGYLWVLTPGGIIVGKIIPYRRFSMLEQKTLPAESPGDFQALSEKMTELADKHLPDDGYLDDYFCMEDAIIYAGDEKALRTPYIRIDRASVIAWTAAPGTAVQKH